jgi:hypothetical protein
MLHPPHHLQQLKGNVRHALPPRDAVAAASHYAVCACSCALLIGHDRTLAAKAEPSCPSHPTSAHAAIKGTFPVHFVRTTSFLSVVSRHRVSPFSIQCGRRGQPSSLPLPPFVQVTRPPYHLVLLPKTQELHLRRWSTAAPSLRQ